MSKSEKAKRRAAAAMASKGCAAALALTPLVVPVVCPNRARASVLFGLTQKTVSDAPSFPDYGSGTLFDSGLYTLNSSTRLDQGIHVTGSFGPIHGSDMSFGPVVNFHFGGDLNGYANVGDTAKMNIHLNVATTGSGTVTFVGAHLNTSAALYAFDDYSALVSGGDLSIFLESSQLATYDNMPLSLYAGTWSLDFGLSWNGFAAGDTLAITIPEGSVDAFVTPAPEPAMLMVLPVAVLLMRRRMSARPQA